MVRATRRYPMEAAGPVDGRGRPRLRRTIECGRPPDLGNPCGIPTATTGSARLSPRMCENQDWPRGPGSMIVKTLGS